MKLTANGIGLEVDDQGPVGGRPLLMVMGLGMQLIGWPQPMVDALAARGFRVLRFDNRDAGLSDGFDHLGVPNLAFAGMRHLLRLPVKAPYTLDDMAADAWGLADALGLGAIDLCGASMGGMVAQLMLLQQPARVRSLTLMMTHSGARGLPRPSMAVQRALMARPPRRAGRDALLDHLERTMTLVGSPGYPTPSAQLRPRLAAAVDRAYRPAGVARQLCAVIAAGDRRPGLRAQRVPVHVIHGADDPLVPPAAAHDLVRTLPGATLDLVPGMGHDLPAPLLPRFVDGLATNACRAAPTVGG